MSWLDQLRPASFRGVPFHVDSIEHSAGDNVVLREYPFADLPTVFRMGEAAEEIAFSAYVIGDDYLDKRDALRQVLTGQGVLVHPTAGTMQVFVAGKYTVREAPTSEGGMARFDLRFVRAEPRRYPAGVANSQAEASSAAEVARSAAAEAFGRQWAVAGRPGWVAEQAMTRLQETLSGAWTQIAAASQGVGAFNDTLTGNYQVLRDGLSGLMATPAALAGQVRLLFALPDDLTQAQARAFQNAFAWAWDLDSAVPKRRYESVVLPDDPSKPVIYGLASDAAPVATGAATAQLEALQAESDRLLECLATAAWVDVTARVELSSYDEAMAARAALASQCQRLLMEGSELAASEAMPGAGWHEALLGLLTRGLADLQGRSRDLVRLTTYTPGGWEPVWLISYKVHGTPDYADEILAMNAHIRHPLLVPPGQALRIVRHG